MPLRFITHNRPIWHEVDVIVCACMRVYASVAFQQNPEFISHSHSDLNGKGDFHGPTVNFNTNT